MRTRLALLGVVAALTGACKDHPARPASETGSAGPAAAARGAPPPTLPSAEHGAGASIDNLSDAPPEARERLVNTVKAIEHNQTAEFVAMVSTSGFTVGTFSLVVDQVERELAGRSISELTTLPCEGASAAGCRWNVTMLDAKHVELEARANGSAVGTIELIREDDDSWGLYRAYPTPR
jgi:hypothetical protein